jgi:signal transduction histidine kinase
MVLSLVLPLGRLLGLTDLFDPTAFLLPGPADATLGRVLFIGLALVWCLGFLGKRVRWPHLNPLMAGVSGAVVLSLVVGIMRDGVGASASSWSQGGMVALQLSLVMAGGLLIRPLLGGRDVGEARGRRLVLGALVIAGGLAAALVFLARTMPPLSGFWILAWAIPITMAAAGVSRGWGRWAPGIRWVLAVVMALSAGLPFIWNDWIQARQRQVEDQLAVLGTQGSPYQTFLLYRWGEVTDSLFQAGARDVEVLYRGWVESGLAEEGIEVDLTLWSAGGLPLEELRIGVTGPRSSLALELLETLERGGGAQVRSTGRADANFVGLVPLADGSVATAVIPPRRRLPSETPLGPLLTPGDDLSSSLTLAPAEPGSRLPGPEAPIWRRADGGWRAEAEVRFPDGRVHASYLLELPSPALVAARGTLMAVLDLWVLAGVWWLGLLMGRGVHPSWTAALQVLSTFRARVTLALFLFFLLPTTLFGTLVFRSVAGAAQRTAEVLAGRAAETGALSYFSMQGALEPLAARSGSDLLLYADGRLVDGSSPELLRLGLYDGWIPRPVQESLTRGESLRTVSRAHLGSWEYVMAFRTVAETAVLAAPASLEQGTDALRPREFADLFAFALLMGAALSLALAFLVGRALSRPLQTLLVASERVGTGNLEVRLPGKRGDEFGSVFSAFNRMVRRLGAAREELVRSTRRSEAIVEEAAAGVIALDAQGRVTIANARARTLLGGGVQTGQVLPRGQGPRGEVAAWIGRYFRDGLMEASGEFQMDERRVRIRARRVSQDGPGQGAVVILEDVTDELRSERILAWGEMARQVAHEVKNPLTPMKLSIQHIQRAWQDGHPAYGEILNRNADAVLREIDRLASISRSFARLAPPGEGEAPSLESVDVSSVVADVLGLYRGGGGAIEFVAEFEEALPPIRARETEFKEVLINLLENARVALEPGGRVVITGELVGEHVDVTVMDDGSGIDPDVLPRVFEPHFSTRTGGTGLGLAIVYRVVRSWGGVVSAESDPGRGTRIRMSVPVFREEGAGGVPNGWKEE